MKQTFVIFAIFIFVFSIISCDDGMVRSTDSYPYTEKEQDTSEIITPDTTVYETPQDTTALPTFDTPAMYEERFTGYTPIDFDMVFESSDDRLYYAYCGKGMSVIGDLAVVSPLYGYNSRYTSYTGLCVIREDRKSDICVSSWGIQCTADTLKALDDMNIALENAFPDSPYKLLVRSGLTKSTDTQNGEFYSEHLTGRMLSLAFYDGSVTYKIDSNNLRDQSRWLTENCAKFGFIVRYPQSKEDVTGVDYSCSEFRYVGIPHAKYMYENKLCLEEYTEKLKSYTIDKPLLTLDDNNNKYKIYYQSANTSSATAVPIEKTTDFSISGDNRGGFIVTQKLSPDA